MNTGSVLVFARDPGAANHLLALVELLQGDETPGLPALCRLRDAYGAARFAFYGRTHALAVWRRSGVEAADWDTHGPDAAPLDALLARLGTSAVLTGTSDIDEASDCGLWRAAARLGIPSVAIVDHESSTAFRFCDEDGAVWPETILVPDGCVAEAVRAAGAPARAVVETGNLHVARIARRREAVGRDAPTRLRKDWGAGREDRVVLFASECAREMAALGRPAPYDEVALLEGLVSALAKGGGTDPLVGVSSRTVVVVRLHPRDRRDKYDDIAAPQPLRLIVSAAGAPEEAILASDIVVGMQSSLLLEAAALGVPAHSLTGWTQLDSKVA